MDFVDVYLAEVFHVLEHLVGQFDTFARIFKSLLMVLVLTEDGTELELQLALLVCLAATHRHPLALVELLLQLLVLVAILSLVLTPHQEL